MRLPFVLSASFGTGGEIMRAMRAIADSAQSFSVHSHKCMIYCLEERIRGESMDEYRTTEQLEQESRKAAEPEKQEYTPRPKSQIILAWILAAVVIFAFLGTCYWMAFYGT